MSKTVATEESVQVDKSTSAVETTVIEIETNFPIKETEGESLVDKFQSAISRSNESEMKEDPKEKSLVDEKSLISDKSNVTTKSTDYENHVRIRPGNSTEESEEEINLEIEKPNSESSKEEAYEFEESELSLESSSGIFGEKEFLVPTQATKSSLIGVCIPSNNKKLREESEEEEKETVLLIKPGRKAKRTTKKKQDVSFGKIDQPGSTVDHVENSPTNKHKLTSEENISMLESILIPRNSFVEDSESEEKTQVKKMPEPEKQSVSMSPNGIKIINTTAENSQPLLKQSSEIPIDKFNFCYICKDKIKIKAVTPCGCEFCFNCINRHIKRQRNCPNGHQVVFTSLDLHVAVEKQRSIPKLMKKTEATLRKFLKQHKVGISGPLHRLRWRYDELLAVLEANSYKKNKLSNEDISFAIVKKEESYFRNKKVGSLSQSEKGSIQKKLHKLKSVIKKQIGKN